MIVTLIVLAVAVVTAVGLWRLLRHQTPHPIEERRTVDYGQLRAMWPPDGGIE
jgi:hypothetical protein